MSALTVNAFLAAATAKAADELVRALDSLSPEYRVWQPAPSARCALDQFAECALLNGNTADLVERRAGKPLSYGDEFTLLKAALLRSEDAARALFRTNTARAIAAIERVPADQWDDTIPLPWGPILLGGLLRFPYENMTYHTGQIVYIASLLDL